MRLCGAIEQQQHGHPDADDQPGEGVEQQHARHRGDGGQEIGAGGMSVDAAEPGRPHPVQAAQRGDIHEFDDRGDDHTRQRRLRQVLEQPGQKQQRQDHEYRDHEPTELGSGPRAAVDGGLGEAAVDHHAGAEPGPEVGRAETEQLAVRIHLVACLGRIGFRGAEPFGETDQQDSDRRAEQIDQVADAHAVRHTDRGQARVDMADDGHAVVVEVEHRDRGDAEQHRQQ